MPRSSTTPRDDDRRPESPGRWGWAAEFAPALDFLLQVVIEDGLWVPPFQAHPQHVGPLQARGFTAEIWREWIGLVAERLTVMNPDVYMDPVALAPTPIAAWGLQARWSDYLVNLPQSDSFNALSFQDVDRHLDSTAMRSYFESGKAGLPRLHVCIVRYVKSAWMMVTPNVAILGDGDLTASTLVEIVHQAGAKQMELNARSVE